MQREVGHFCISMYVGFHEHRVSIQASDSLALDQVKSEWAGLEGGLLLVGLSRSRH